MNSSMDYATTAYSAVKNAVDSAKDPTLKYLDSNALVEDIATDDSNSRLYTTELQRMSMAFGNGPYYHRLRTFFRETNKFDHINTQTNSLLAGYTFITRPRLCLHDASITKHTSFFPMYTDNYNAMVFALRCLMDTRFCQTDARGRKCQLIDHTNGLFTPINNGLVGMSGWPDINLETSTTQAGFHSEDQTMVKGYDQLNKTYELTLDFVDPQGGPILAIFFYWVLYMGLLSKGMLPAYFDDIIHRRMNYTVSIYRFIVDPSRRMIVHYAKATGCFPKSVPMGPLFNFSEGDRFIRSAGRFSIPFVANKVEYNRPEIIGDFKQLIKRYDPYIEKRATQPLLTSTNYSGHPYIYSGTGGNTGIAPLQLVFK